MYGWATITTVGNRTGSGMRDKQHQQRQKVTHRLVLDRIYDYHRTKVTNDGVKAESIEKIYKYRNAP